MKLVDLYGRNICYLRVSVTDRCNMRCGYCHESTAISQNLRRGLDEGGLIRLIEAFALLGVNKIRFTGGEPLVRPGLISLVSRIKQIRGIKIIGVTTNGLLLDKYISQLIKAGLNRINISLDTLDKQTFRVITGTDGLDRVLAGVNAACASGAFPIVKINAVVVRGMNDHEIKAMVLWALERGIDIRFIEFMPTEKSGWSREKFVSEREMKEKIGMELIPLRESNDSHGPAATFYCRGYQGRVSFISAVSGNVCTGCNRLRVTSSGQIVGCLFQDEIVNPEDILKGGTSIDKIAERLSEIVSRPGFRRNPNLLLVPDYRPLMKAVGG